MKRFGFLKLLGASAAAVAMAPLLAKEAAVLAQPEAVAVNVYRGSTLITTRHFFAAQSRVLERIYMKDIGRNTPPSFNVIAFDEKRPRINFGTAFEQ